MSLQLKIQVKNKQTAMKFAPTMSVAEVCAQIKEKTGEGGEDHGLFQAALEGKHPARWLKLDKALQFYDLRTNDILDFKKKHRPMKIKLMDDTVRTFLMDDSMTVSEISEYVGKKMGVKNPEEFSLQVDGAPSTEWLNTTLSLNEQNVTDDMIVVFKKKWYVDDANINRDDPVQLHLVYVQVRDGIVSGSHPCTYEEAISFASLQCQIQLGNHNPGVHKPGYLKIRDYLSPSAAKRKTAEKDIYNEFRKLVGMSEVNAKYRYVQLCRSLKTYGITFFQTKERVKGQKKPQPKLLGITRDQIIRLDFESKEIEHEYPLTHLRRWAASPQSFTLDFGDYEEEYVSVITTEGEAISQLIAGYIDILLKKRRDTGGIIEDNENMVADVESISRVRGMAGVATTQSNVGAYEGGSGREQQFGPGGQPMARRGTQVPGGIAVTNVDQAQTAIANVINELDANPQPVPGSYNNLSPQQWRQQIQTSAKGIAAGAGKLGNITGQPGNIDKNALNNEAKQIAYQVEGLINAARNGSLIDPDDQDAEMPLIDGAKAVAEAIAKVLKSSKDVSNNPQDPKKREELKNAQDGLKAALAFLDGASRGELADEGTSRLIAESAKAIAAATNALATQAKDGQDQLGRGTDNQLTSAINAANYSAATVSQTAMLMAPAILNADCKKIIVDQAKAVQVASAYLLAAAKNSGLDPEGLGLNEAAKSVSDAIQQLLQASEMAEPRGGSDPEFAEAAKAIVNATSLMLGAKGSTEKISAAARAIAEATNPLVSGARRLAQNEDEPTKTRLMNCTKQVAEASKNVAELSASAVAAPDDVPLFNKLAEASKKLAMLVKQLTGDSGKQAAMQALRTNSKFAAAATTSLVNAARQAGAQMIGTNDEEANNLFAAAQAAADAIAKLMKPLSVAQKSPDDEAAQNALLEASRKVAPLAYKLVATSKSVAPLVTSRTKKDELNMAAMSASEAIKHWVESTAGAHTVAGEPDFDQALEQLEAQLADLESAAMFASQGMLEAEGSREDSLELLNVSTRGLSGACKDLVGNAKVAPDKLGPSSKNLADAVKQVVTASKAVASATPNKAVQKAVLGAAKHLASQSESLVGCAKALKGSPKDPQLSSALNSAAKSTAEGLVQLIATAKGSDPVGKDIEDALTAVHNSVKQLHASPVAMGGDHAANSSALASCVKAVSAASQQLTSSAKKNPGAVGSSAKTVAGTTASLVEAANAAAGSNPNKAGAQAVLSATKHLAQQLDYLMNNARNASHKPGDADAEMALNTSAKNVTDAIVMLMGKLENSSPDQRKIAEALEDVRGSLQKLENPSITQIPNALDGLSKAAKAVADATSQLIQARDKPDQLAAAAQKAATNYGMVVDCAKASAACASGQAVEGPENLATLAKSVQLACENMNKAANSPVLDPNAKKEIIMAAKGAALATQSLVSGARQCSTAYKSNDPEQSKALLNAAQNVANSTSKLVQYSKDAAAGSPPPKPEVAKSTADLNKAIADLLQRAQNSPQVASADLENLTPASKNLMSAASAIGQATVNLLEASKSYAGGNKESLPALSSAAKAASSATQALLNAANGLKPGQAELDTAIEAIQNACVDLDSASLNAAIGALVAPAGNNQPPAAAQAQVAELAKEVASCVRDLVTAAKSSPDGIANSARAAGTAVPKLAEAAKTAASLTRDQTAQQDQLTGAKDLADSMLELLMAAKSGNLAELTQQAKNASQKIAAVLNQKVGGPGAAEFDAAAGSIRNALAGLDKPVKATKKTEECLTELGTLAKSLAATISNLSGVVKTKPDEIGAAARNVSLVIPNIVEQTRLAAASTNDSAAKKSLLDGASTLGNATNKFLEDARACAADRKNAQLQTAMAASMKDITGVIAKFVANLKDPGAALGQDVDAALDEINKIMSDLDSASLFAAAGQLEADVTGQTIESTQANLLQMAKAIAGACNQLVGCVDGPPDQLGPAAKQLASCLNKVSKTTKVAACIGGDSVSQQAMLTAARAVAITGQQLVIAARQAQKVPGTVSQTALSGASNAVTEAVNQLIAESQNASADASRGVLELDNAAADIRKMLAGFDSPQFKAKDKATAADVVTSARSVAESTAHLVAACNNSPEDIYAAAKSTADATRSLLENAKGSTALTDDQVIQTNVCDAAKAVANSTTRLIAAAKAQRADAQNPAAQQKLSATAGDVIAKIEEVVNAAGDLPEGERAMKMYLVQENLEEIAETELLAAAAVIEKATATLLEAKRKAEAARASNGLDVSGVDEALLDAARAIAAATSVLVSAATSAQKEIVASGKASKGKTAYRRDPTWARGLISAAQSVAGAVQTLVTSANDGAQGNADQETIVASARGVAASTARLVAASRAKSDPMSATQQKLSSAAKTVATATSDLVKAAKEISDAKMEEETQVLPTSSTATGAIKAEMEAQARILRLQRELDAARFDLTNKRKLDYAQATAESAAPKPTTTSKPPAKPAAGMLKKKVAAKPAAAPTQKLPPTPQ